MSSRAEWGAGQKTTMENESFVVPVVGSVEWDHGLIILLLLTLSAECARWCGKSR